MIVSTHRRKNANAELLITNKALKGALGNRGKRSFISAEQRPKFEGNRGIKTILGNGQNKKIKV